MGGVEMENGDGTGNGTVTRRRSIDNSNMFVNDTTSLLSQSWSRQLRPPIKDHIVLC